MLNKLVEGLQKNTNYVFQMYKYISFLVCWSKVESN